MNNLTFSDIVIRFAKYYEYRSRKRVVAHPAYKQSIKETHFLPNESTIGQRIWHILNNTKAIPVCQLESCNSTVNWFSRKKEYLIIWQEA